MDVAGERGLSDVEAAPGKTAAQLVLAGDVGLDEDVADCGVALLFQGAVSSGDTLYDFGSRIR